MKFIKIIRILLLSFILILFFIFILFVVNSPYKNKLIISPEGNETNYLPYDPVESSKKARDSGIYNDMVETYIALEEFYQKYNYYPWQDSLKKEMKIYTKIDNNILQKLVDSDLMKIKFVDKINQSVKTITLFVNDNDKIYLCTDPESKEIIEVSNIICVNNPNIKDTVVCNKEQKLMCISNDVDYFDYF